KLLDGQPEPPKYFKMMKHLNKKGPKVLNEIRTPKKLSVDEFRKAMQDGYYVIDTRNKNSFTKEHIEGTINIQNNNSFSTWAGRILKYDKPFVLNASGEKIEDINKKLIRIGLDNCSGYFDDINKLKENSFRT